MSRASAAATITGYGAALLLAFYAAIEQFVTLATSDPHRYQPVLLSGMCCIAWWSMATRWPFVFG